MCGHGVCGHGALCSIISFAGFSTRTFFAQDMSINVSLWSTNLAAMRLYRYFKPRASGTLKCSPEAMKMWKTDSGRDWVQTCVPAYVNPRSCILIEICRYPFIYQEPCACVLR